MTDKVVNLIQNILIQLIDTVKYIVTPDTDTLHLYLYSSVKCKNCCIA